MIIYGPTAKKALDEAQTKQDYLEESKRFIAQWAKTFPDYYLHIGKSHKYNVYFTKRCWWNIFLMFEIHYDIRDKTLYCTLDDVNESELISKKIGCDVFVYGV